jgi:hypothetical protein
MCEPSLGGHSEDAEDDMVAVCCVTLMSLYCTGPGLEQANVNLELQDNECMNLFEVRNVVSCGSCSFLSRC